MLLLDSCTLMWLVDDQSKLSKSAIDCLREERSALYVSAISASEIAQKHFVGKLRLPLSPESWFRRALDVHSINEVPITSEIAIAAAELPRIHKDPCDRIIVATAKISSMEIL